MTTKRKTRKPNGPRKCSGYLYSCDKIAEPSSRHCQSCGEKSQKADSEYQYRISGGRIW